MVLADSTRDQILTLKARYPSARSAVLPSLWALQHQLGYISAEGMREVAVLLDLAPSEVQAVSTFYSMYFQHPAGAHSVVICTNVSCALRDSDALVAHTAERLGCASGETSADGAFTWESTVECLGACGGAPALQIDHHTYENVTPEQLDALLIEFRGRPGHGGHGQPGRSAEAATEAAGRAASERTTVERKARDTGAAAPPARESQDPQ
jgi:NADH-quinone oxidoreductase subunit E